MPARSRACGIPGRLPDDIRRKAAGCSSPRLVRWRPTTTEYRVCRGNRHRSGPSDRRGSLRHRAGCCHAPCSVYDGNHRIQQAQDLRHGGAACCLRDHCGTPRMPCRHARNPRSLPPSHRRKSPCRHGSSSFPGRRGSEDTGRLPRQALGSLQTRGLRLLRATIEVRGSSA